MRMRLQMIGPRNYNIVTMFNQFKAIWNFFCLPMIICAALAACADQSQNPQELGARYFKGYGCATCHRIAGEGGAYGPDLTFVGYRKTPQWLDVWFKNPHAWKSNTPMPNFNLPDNVRDALVRYLALQKGDAYRKNPPWNTPELMADSVKSGAVIYDRVGCVGC